VDRDKPDFLLPVLVLSALFRRRMLEAVDRAHKAGRLTFFGDHAHLAARDAFEAFLAPLKQKDWHVYAKRPFAGPKAVLVYLSRYTHRVAISNSRLLAVNERGVTFRVKNYRVDGPARYTTMTLSPHEFIRRFLIHVLPKGLHRIRHYGLLANGQREANLAKARALLAMPAPETTSADTIEAATRADQSEMLARSCPCCGARMFIVETFESVCPPRHRPSPAHTMTRIDTS
jgi:hypothetical protein